MRDNIEIAVTAAELALKAHYLAGNRDLIGGTAAEASIDTVNDTVDLAEAPEDALFSLLLDLMSYCQSRGIDWEKDVVAEVRKYLASECEAARP